MMLPDVPDDPNWWVDKELETKLPCGWKLVARRSYLGSEWRWTVDVHHRDGERLHTILLASKWNNIWAIIKFGLRIWWESK